MSQTQISDKVARPVRTAAQAAPAVIITQAVDVFIHPLSNEQYGVLVALLTLLFAWIQVLIENNIGKAFLRRIPERKTPVVDKDAAA